MNSPRASPLSTSVRLSAFFGAICFIYGVHMTYLPVWLDSRGLTPFEIGITSSAPLIIRLLLTPSAAFVADRNRAHREMIIAACGLGLLALLGLKGTSGVLATIVLVTLMQVSLTTIMPLADAVTLSGVRERGLDYGRIRLWGSLTFIVAGYLAGWMVTSDGPDAVLYLSLIGGGVALGAALWLPRAEASGRAPLTLPDALALVRDRTFLVFILASGITQASHAVLYVFGVLHWRSQGLTASYIATLWAISVLAEIALFWAARWITWLAPIQLMILGAAAGLVRWLAMAFDPAPYWLVPLQLLHAGTFAATHLGAMQWIAARVPAAAAGTAQALLSTISAGIVMSSVTLVAGLLYASFAGRAYLAMVAASALGLLAGIALMRLEARR
jgi:PPP family 3-phenylpropionic acid transporter